MTDDGTLLGALFARRDRERRERVGSRLSIIEADARYEKNAQGAMRWYLHPDMPGACIDSMIVYRYEIPPHGATGRQRVQGNVVSYVLTGFGHTVVNDVTHDWEAGDVIAFPPLMRGIEFQHFNDSSEEVQLITAEPNLVGVYGVDLGSGFEQLEDAPGGDE